MEAPSIQLLQREPQKPSCLILFNCLSGRVQKPPGRSMGRNDGVSAKGASFSQQSSHSHREWRRGVSARQSSSGRNRYRDQSVGSDGFICRSQVSTDKSPHRHPTAKYKHTTISIKSAPSASPFWKLCAWRAFV